ncbi:MAG: 4-hydroxybenzoyl-CoA thioesterase [Nevskia sp.]|nr:4-hydroxybenzoyl-CoA thioesterase [Nevskia sp.]
MKRSAEVTIQIPFHDVDLVGIVWHGHYAKYFEIARCALLESFDYNYDRMLASGYGWPVIDLRLRYVKPAQFGQKIRVRATLLEWENRLRIEYLVTDDASGQRLTKGESVQVAVNIATREMCMVSPDVLFERLGEPKP